MGWSKYAGENFWDETTNSPTWIFNNNQGVLNTEHIVKVGNISFKTGLKKWRRTLFW